MTSLNIRPDYGVQSFVIPEGWKERKKKRKSPIFSSLLIPDARGAEATASGMHQKIQSSSTISRASEGQKSTDLKDPPSYTASFIIIAHARPCYFPPGSLAEVPAEGSTSQQCMYIREYYR